eukprot:TRINITY_DN5735_c0_g1_i1.p3 TRINITY_DN5735_c0_g1~~TRINITY_DN5735_c0_g1_i1.p3  ORF type:complete len:159 (+),score=17.45 TRINITY_DN5735_c0_g1_i1:786-1262(+)
MMSPSLNASSPQSTTVRDVVALTKRAELLSKPKSRCRSRSVAVCCDRRRMTRKTTTPTIAANTTAPMTLPAITPARWRSSSSEERLFWPEGWLPVVLLLVEADAVVAVEIVVVDEIAVEVAEDDVVEEDDAVEDVPVEVVPVEVVPVDVVENDVPVEG